MTYMYVVSTVKVVVHVVVHVYSVRYLHVVLL